MDSNGSEDMGKSEEVTGSEWRITAKRNFFI